MKKLPTPKPIKKVAPPKAPPAPPSPKNKTGPTRIKGPIPTLKVVK